MDSCCGNCGWSEIVGSPTMCNYSGHGTRRDECCKAWKPKKEAENMVQVVLCKDCKHRTRRVCNNLEFWECNHLRYEIAKCGVTDDWFCADGERKESR